MGLAGTCIADGAASSRGAAADVNDVLWLRASVASARAAISAPPGSGQVRGVWIYADQRYCFRDNEDGTACVMFVESADGWAVVPLGYKLSFTSGGTVEIAEGDVIVGETSGASATVNRVVVTSGTWGAGTAAGYFVFTSDARPFQSETVKVGATTNLANIAGDSVAITLLPGGRYDFDNYNFFGQASTIRMYGADGVNPGFEFDGTVFCPITTNSATDTPTHVRAHKKHLFFMYPGGSVKHSGIGYPLKWDAPSGAAEIGVSDKCVGMDQQPGGILALWARNSTTLLYGNDATDWELKNHSRDTGAIEWTNQSLSQSVYLDDRGVTSLSAVQAFGDFAGATISQSVAPVIAAKKSLAISSLRVRSKDQYRLFFSDNTGLSFTFSGGKLVGITRVDYGMPVRCCCSGEIGGEEVLLFGSDNGYIYQLDKGTSFDSGEIDAIIRLPFNHLKYPEHNKRFFKAVLELDAPGGASLLWSGSYDYGAEDGPQQTVSATSGGGSWDIDNWNEFLWSTVTIGSGEAYLHGTGKNMGIFIGSRTAYEEPHTLQGITLHYSVWGLSR